MNDLMKQTIVEEGTEIEGSVKSTVPVHVSGAVRGDVAAPSLTVSASGSVRGSVKVTELRSEGELAGRIDAERVQLSGRVSDQTAIRATTLEVKLAQADGKLEVTFGNVDLHVGERAVATVTAEPPAVKPETVVRKSAPPKPDGAPKVEPELKLEEPKVNHKGKRAET